MDSRLCILDNGVKMQVTPDQYLNTTPFMDKIAEKFVEKLKADL